MTAAPQEKITQKDKPFEVAINGTEMSLDHNVLTYEELGQLAHPGHDPEAKFTVTYRNADPSRGGQLNGTLIAGEKVTVKKKGTTFDVRLTTRS
ncbi:multiubiquitin [Nocardioides albertanoniae]|uniref:Multiubiquitin n=1 Tax=Nocardioides albertanoniae TaxID=1175486 RepID=A0A543A8Q9_9ACTN|nr:multiubiquitin domain-containing protein [Nocardioides albertanoniae]TQL68919.1 multiubiquitin [Nocardioides albertanoniae]